MGGGDLLRSFTIKYIQMGYHSPLYLKM